MSSAGIPIQFSEVRSDARRVYPTTPLHRGRRIEIVRAMRALVIATLLCVFFVANASGQAEGPWLILPVTSTDDDLWVEPTAAKVRSELVERDVEVWSFDSAVTRFEAEGSAPAAEITEGDIQQWVDQSSAAIRNLAAGDYDTALEQLNQAQQLSLAAAEELNREKERAQQVLDTCLYIVRALLETRSESRAKTMAQECRRLVPRGDPSALMHPPVVTELLEQIDTSRAEQTGSIRVDSRPSTCAVRVNGVMLGETPFEMRDLFPGQYRVQVECDPERRGRVHIADVIAGRTDVLLDLRFDRVIETRPLLHLHYASASDAEQYRIADAAEISKVLPAGALLLMSSPASDVVELEVYRGTPLVMTALARITMGSRGPSRGDVALAVRTLLEGRCTDFTSPEPTALPCGEPEFEIAEAEPTQEEWPSDRRPRGQYIAGWTLVGVGSASLLTGYVLMAPRASTAEDWVSGLDTTGVSDPSTQQKWLSTGTGIIATSSIGASALVAAMPLVLPKRDKTPWWAWFSGALGLGAAAISGYVASTVNDQAKPETSCSSTAIDAAEARACVRRSERTNLAILTGLTAAPLLTIPMVYLIRPKAAKVSSRIEVLRAGGSMSFRGEF